MASREKLLADLLEQSKIQSGLITELGSNSVMDDILAAATKILSFTIDQAKVLDSIGMKNSTLNVSFDKLKAQIMEQGHRFGTIGDQMQMQLNLHKIGYKNTDKSLRDSLVWLDKADGQGQDIVKFMEKMSESGTTHETQTAIAKHLIDIADHTQQSSRAALASLQELGTDIPAMLQVLGLQGDVSKAILNVTKGLPTATSINLGKFMKEVMDPKNMAQQFNLGVAGPLTKVLMSNTSTTAQKQEAILAMIASASDKTSGVIKQGARDPFVIQQLAKTLAGDLGMLGLKLQGQLINGKNSADGTAKMRESSARTYYDGSLERMTDLAKNTAQLVPMARWLHGINTFLLGSRTIDTALGSQSQVDSISASKFDDDTPWRVGQTSMLNYLPDWLGGMGTDAADYHAALNKFKADTAPLTHGNFGGNDQKKAAEQRARRGRGEDYEIWRDSKWIPSTDHKRNAWSDPYASVNRKEGTYFGGKKEDTKFGAGGVFLGPTADPVKVVLTKAQELALSPNATPPPVVQNVGGI